jgi:AraC-like DNA-binding protein
MSRPDSLQELLLAYLARCYALEEQPRSGTFAKWLGVSRDTLYEWCIAEFGLPPSTLLREDRLLRAEGLLTQDGSTTTKVAYVAAFGSRANLFREFRRRRETTPRSKHL